MNERENNGNAPASGLNLRQTLGIAAVGVVALHLGDAVASLSFLMLVFLPGMACLSLAEARRQAFYPALAVGIALYAPQPGFFWRIFGPAARVLQRFCWLWLSSAARHHIQKPSQKIQPSS